MNIRQVRKKIRSVTNVKKITKAMELVSAIKMKKAQQLAIEARPYQQNLESIINKITAKIDPRLSPLLQTSDDQNKKKLAIIISTNKGLCGSFNFNLFHFLINNCQTTDTDFITVGKKASFFINKIGGNILADFSQNLAMENVSAIFQFVLNSFLEKKYQQILIFYQQFISTLKSQPTKEILLPIKYQPVDQSVLKKKEEEYLIEPSPQEIIDDLLKSFLETKIINAIIQSEAAEHSARMIAMKNATDNANEVINELISLRNKVRQEKITYELLDMMTATTLVS
ncbi:MAG: ATP synthase F1 subunit gamma [Microgenomates group bacterium]|nr:ATP synthase F1 subunit gamma [Microgenomates group bacterium]